MTESTSIDTPVADTEATEAEAQVPWWNIESPLRRRIKGRYVRSAIMVACMVNIALVAYAPRLMAPADAVAVAAVPGLRPALPTSQPASAETLARMAALAP